METETICRDIYRETRAFYASKKIPLGSAAQGFRILYGPPIANAPYIFVGYQPGGVLVDALPDEHDTWPAEFDYTYEKWPLAVYARETWGLSVLKQCTALNSIFFRARSIDEWQHVSRSLRDEIERFCRSRAERIVRALRPHRIVVVGMNTFHDLTNGGDISLKSDKRVLVKTDFLWGTPVYGIIHLSGARISRVDRDKLAAYFAALPNRPDS